MRYIIFTALICISGCASTKNLPHRPIHEVDIQGHQNLAPQHKCQAVYDAPTGDLDLCWGEVTKGEAGTTYSDLIRR